MILGIIVDVPGVKNKLPLHTILGQVLPALGDNKVVLRKECLDLAMKIIKVI